MAEFKCAVLNNYAFISTIVRVIVSKWSFAPFKATASSFTLIVQPLIRISVQASMSIASVLGALTGAEGLVMRQLR